MFNKINARKYRKFYLWFNIICFLLSFILVIVSGVILDTLHHWVLSLVIVVFALVFLLIFIISMILGRKRFVTLNHELMMLDIKEHIKNPQPLKNMYFNTFRQNQTIEENTLLIDGIGIHFCTYEIAWADISEIEVVQYDALWFFKIKKGTADDFLDNHLIVSTEFVEILLSHYYQKAFNDKDYIKQAEFLDEAFRVRKIFGFNHALFIEKIIFSVSIIMIAISLGVLIETKFSNYGVSVGGVFAITIFSVVYPHRYKNIPKQSYVIDPIGLGYAQGRKYFFVPWNDVISIKRVKKYFVIYIFNQGNEHEVFFKFDQRIVDQITKINETREEKIIYREDFHHDDLDNQ